MAMICPYCGASTDRRIDRFCLACGIDLGDPAPEQQPPDSSRDPRASRIPTRLFRICPRCQEKTSDRSIYCPTCGNQLGGQDVVSKHTRPAQTRLADASAGPPPVVRGDMLWSRYQVECVLRGESDRTVLRARDMVGQLGTVVLEVLHGRWIEDADAQERLRVRVEETAPVEAAGLQRLYAFERDQRYVGLVKEWIPGATLAHHWRGQVERATPHALTGHSHPRLVLRFAEQVGKALDAVHRARLVHGMLRPDAIIVCPGEEQDGVRQRARVVLAGLDHGVVPGEETLDWNEDRLRSYRAPEWRNTSGPPGPHADRFAFGALAYRLMTGEEAGWPPRPPTQLVPTLQPDLAAPVMAYLKHQPASRPATAAALGDALRSALERPTTAARAADPDEVDPDAVTLPVVPAMAPPVASLSKPTFQPPAPDHTPAPDRMPAPDPAPRAARQLAAAARPELPVDPGSIALQNGLLPGLGFHSLGEKGLAAGTFAVAVVVWVISLGSAGWIVHVVAAIAGHNMALQRNKDEQTSRETETET